jgi:hypothetical protein
MRQFDGIPLKIQNPSHRSDTLLHGTQAIPQKPVLIFPKPLDGSQTPFFSLRNDFNQRIANASHLN